MPIIKQYEQQTGRPQDIQQSNVSVNTAGLPSEALAGMGESVANLGEKIHKWDTRKDVHDVHMNDSELRAKYEQRIIQESQNGSIDAQKISDDFLKESSQFKARTNQGQEYLDEQMSQLHTQVIKSAATAQAKIAGEQSALQWGKSIATNADTIRQSPSTFYSSYKSSLAAIDSDVSNGTMSPVDGEKMKVSMADTYAQAFFTGMAESGQGGPDKAQNILESGAFDEYLSEKSRKSISGTIRTYKNSEETERKRQIKVQKDAHEKTAEAWKLENMDKLIDGSLSTKDILNSPMKSESQYLWTNRLNKSLEKKLKTDPAVKMALTQRILMNDPGGLQIDSSDDIMSYVGKGIDLDAAKELIKLIDNTPQGKILNTQRKAFYEGAKAQIITNGLMPGTRVGYQKLAELQAYALQKENEMSQAGKNPSSIYDVHSKDSIWPIIKKYQATYNDLINTQYPKEEEEENESQRKPGESASDFLNRTKGE